MLSSGVLLLGVFLKYDDFILQRNVDIKQSERFIYGKNCPRMRIICYKETYFLQMICLG